MATTTLCGPLPESAALSAFSSGRKFPTPPATVPSQFMLKRPSASLPGSCTSHQNAVNLRSHFCGFWKYQKFILQRPLNDHGLGGGYVASNVSPKEHVSENMEAHPPLEGKVPDETSPLGSGAHSIDDLSSNSRDIHAMEVGHSEDLQVLDGPSSSAPSLCVAVIGATGELARNKVFPALFALYYSGYLPKNVGIFGYSRKNLTDEDLRSIIAGTLTCRVDHEYDFLETSLWSLLFSF